MPELISFYTRGEFLAFFRQPLIFVSFHQGKEKKDRTEHSHRNIKTSRTCLSAGRFEGRALERNALRKFEEGCKNEIVLLIFGDIVCL